MLLLLRGAPNSVQLPISFFSHRQKFLAPVQLLTPPAYLRYLKASSIHGVTSRVVGAGDYSVLFESSGHFGTTDSVLLPYDRPDAHDLSISLSSALFALASIPHKESHLSCYNTIQTTIVPAIPLRATFRVARATLLALTT